MRRITENTENIFQIIKSELVQHGINQFTYYLENDIVFGQVISLIIEKDQKEQVERILDLIADTVIKKAPSHSIYKIKNVRIISHNNWL